MATGWLRFPTAALVCNPTVALRDRAVPRSPSPPMRLRMATTITPDRIEKQIVLGAPRSRVWRALTDPNEFGTWFGVKLNGPFAAGKRVEGQITIKGYEHVKLQIEIERVEPEK